MNGWSKFFLLIVSCIFVLILWPQYEQESLRFMGMLFLFWTCVIILISVIGNILALYKFELLNRLVSLLFLGALVYSLLNYFPLSNKQTPLLLLKNNVYPTIADIQHGMKRLSFNFDFVRKSVQDESNYVNQQIEKAAEQGKNIQKNIQETTEALDIIVEPFEEEKE